MPPRLRHLIFALAGITTVAGLVGTALSPYLLVHHPLVLTALAPHNRHLVLAAANTPLPALIAIAVARRLLTLGVFYGVGRMFGVGAVDWAKARYPRWQWLVTWVERLFARVGAPLLVLHPGYLLSSLAGALGTRPSVYFIAITLGQVIWVTITCVFGESISAWTRPLIDWLGQHVVEATIVVALLVIAQQGSGYLRRRRKTA